MIPSLIGGGAEHVLINLLRKIDYSRFNIDLCIGVRKGIYFKEIPNFVNVSFLFKNPLFEKLIVFLHRNLNIRFLPKLIINSRIRKNYDTGISFIDSYYTDFLLQLNGKLKRKITWVHASYKSNDNYNKFYKGRYRIRLINERYRLLDKIVFVSNDSRTEFQQIFGEHLNSEIIYNVLNPEEIKLAAHKEPVNLDRDDSINIIAVGSLLPVKAYHKLIRASEKLKNDGLNFKIRIFGEGPQHKMLSKLIYSLNVENHVELSGFRSNPYTYMRASDIFVMTSISEALPTVLCEAMIIGLPCVVTNCSGCREITGNGEFGIMTGQTVDEIYNGLSTLISDQNLRDRYKAKALQRSLIFNDKDTMDKIYSIL